MVERFKYPSTPHLPWSPGNHREDKVLDDVSHFQGKEVVVTEKMDGENTNIYSDGTWHARSLDTEYHPTREIVGKIAGEKAWQLEDGYRICGENLFGKHSIKYTDLRAYFQVFSIWEDNYCLSWDDTLSIIRRLTEIERKFGADITPGPNPSIVPVPALYRGVFDEDMLRSWDEETLCQKQRRQVEGYVVRLAGGFSLQNGATSLGGATAKWVRPNHWVRNWELDGEKNELFTETEEETS